MKTKKLKPVILKAYNYEFNNDSLIEGYFYNWKMRKDAKGKYKVAIIELKSGKIIEREEGTFSFQ